MNNDVIQLTSKDALVIGLHVLKFHCHCLKALNFRSEKPVEGPKEGQKLSLLLYFHR